MAKILCLETATEVCSVALVVDGKIADFKEDLNGQSHSKLLTLYIDEVLKENQLKASDLDAIAISGGPGSYTGLRIGVSASKGLAYAADIPIISISSLQAMADYVQENQTELKIKLGPNNVLQPMIDARRMEVYTMPCNIKAEQLDEVHAKIIDEESYAEVTTNKLFYFGNGASKCEKVLKNPNAVYVENVYASAKNMKNIAIRKFRNEEFEDLAYFEPFYLKEFIATTPKKNILGK